MVSAVAEASGVVYAVVVPAVVVVVANVIGVVTQWIQPAVQVQPNQGTEAMWETAQQIRGRC